MARSVAADLAGLVEDLHRKFDEEREQGRQWRALESITDVTSGLSYLLLGLTLPIVSDGAQRFATGLSWHAAIPVVVTGLLVWFGARLLKATAVVKAHFVHDAGDLGPFLQALANPQPYRAVQLWLRAPNVEPSIKKEVRRVVAAFELGWFAVLISAILFLAAYLSLMFLVVTKGFGIWWGLVILLGASAVIGTILAFSWNAGSQRPALLPPLPVINGGQDTSVSNEHENNSQTRSAVPVNE